MADESRLTHLDDAGNARMVDVSAKDVTARTAVAEGRIRMARATLDALLAGDAPKGDVLGTARLAGAMAAKRTGELIPLCHLLSGVTADVALAVDEALPGVVVRAEAKIAGRTGVEMEALTAATVALLTIYDMVKALDRGMVIEGVRLLRKEGGRSGTWTAPGDGEREG